MDILNMTIDLVGGTILPGHWLWSRKPPPRDVVITTLAVCIAMEPRLPHFARILLTNDPLFDGSSAFWQVLFFNPVQDLATLPSRKVLWGETV